MEVMSCTQVFTPSNVDDGGAMTHSQRTRGNMSAHNWARGTAQFINSALIAMAFQNETSSSAAKYSQRGEAAT